MASKGIQEDRLCLKGEVGSYSLKQGDRLLIDTSSLLWRLGEAPIEVEVFAIAHPMNDQCIGVTPLDLPKDKERALSRYNFRSWNVEEQDITKHYQQYFGRDFVWIATRHIIKKFSQTYDLQEIVNNLQNEIS